MHVPGRRTVAEINIGIIDHVLMRSARSDLQDQNKAIRTVLKVVAVRLPGFEAGAVPGPHDLLPAYSDENHLAFEGPHEPVLGRMPMALS
jgi:hypothetical protein